jgi:hypothetical protein
VAPCRVLLLLLLSLWMVVMVGRLHGSRGHVGITFSGGW